MATKLLVNRLNRRITFQKQDGFTTNDEGISVPNWVDHATVWASRRPLRGREFFAAAAVNAENTVRYEIRYRPGITPDMRLLDSGRTYSISAVLEDVYGDRTQTHVMALEELRNG
ncbi:phage head closure protein [Paenibacillus ehimensis]|uniref:Phage head closure protein n=1 Tax=Paenibacillus ehimensis TaxID=79264 RepID=A0ABT8VHH5_9BACL|nr:phage head closure protein [Paenibacillus ehimensis]MDO3680428.1 phage head closure protein [Paenibacillus ehimensis]